MGVLEDLEFNSDPIEIAKSQAVLQFIRYITGEEFEDWAETEVSDPEQTPPYNPEPLMRADSSGYDESEEEQL